MKHFPDTVLVTGATGDIGRETALRFVEAGARVIFHGRDRQKLDDATKGITTPIYKLACDITDHKAMTGAIATLPPEFREIDLLVNNAGGARGLDKLHEADEADLEAMIAMNVTSLVHLTRLILPSMTARKRGHIVNIGSVAGTWPYPGGNVYGACKAFVRQFSLNLRSDLAGTGVRVTNIEPGMVETGFSDKRFKGDAIRAKKVYADTVPLQAADIAETVYWCATLPAHVNVNTLEVMPTTQSFAPLAVERLPDPAR